MTKNDNYTVMVRKWWETKFASYDRLVDRIKADLKYSISMSIWAYSKLYSKCLEEESIIELRDKEVEEGECANNVLMIPTPAGEMAKYVAIKTREEINCEWMSHVLFLLQLRYRYYENGKDKLFEKAYRYTLLENLKTGESEKCEHHEALYMFALLYNIYELEESAERKDTTELFQLYDAFDHFGVNLQDQGMFMPYDSIEKEFKFYDEWVSRSLYVCSLIRYL